MASEPTLELVARAFCQSSGYTFDKYINSGKYKETFCVHDSERAYALKLCKPEGVSARTEREVEAMQRFSNPNIVKLYDIGTFNYDTISYIFFLEEFLDGGSLGDTIKRESIRKERLIRIACDITCALVDLDHAHIVHRDIKPDNIMFQSKEKRAVLVDFGLVRMLTEESLTQSFFLRGPGTPMFASPEQLNNCKELIDWRSDQFSLGVTLYYAYYKSTPFSDNINEHVEAVARRSRLPQKTKENIEGDGLEPLVRMLSRYPVERFRTPELLLEEFERMIN